MRQRIVQLDKDTFAAWLEAKTLPHDDMKVWMGRGGSMPNPHSVLFPLRQTWGSCMRVTNNEEVCQHVYRV